MSNPRRRSLRDRNAAALAQHPTPAETTQDPDTNETQPTPATPPAERTETRETATVSLGVYLHRDEFQAAKAAYLADWEHGSNADTFARWVTDALEAHTRRTPAQRAEIAAVRTPHEGQGQGRTWPIPTSTEERMREAIRADSSTERWLSRSSWAAEAIVAATAQARERAGGRLPTPPARLPNRLTR